MRILSRRHSRLLREPPLSLSRASFQQVKEHHRKKRKDLKKLESAGKGKKKALKDPGIPNQWPFKDELIAELQQKRLDILAEEQRRKEERKAKRAGAPQPVDAEMGDDLEALRTRAAAQQDEFDVRTRGQGQAGPSAASADKDNSRRAFYKEFRKVVDLSDVILEVLDARDPLSCRCPEVERFVRSISPDKKVVLLLNKIDLAPREVVEQWLRYFREELPCVAFKCSTQKQATNLGQRKSTLQDAGQGSECLGAETLLQLLKNYARNKDIKTAITVGVVGLPNVGKSSLINSLMRTRVANVGNMPGEALAAPLLLPPVG